METISVVIEDIRLFDNEEENNAGIRFYLDKTIPGYAQSGIGYDETNVKKIDMARYEFTEQVCKIDDSISQVRSCRKHPFDQQFLAIIFKKATLEIIREKKTPDDVVLDVYGEPKIDKQTGEEKHYKRDCYITKIVGLRLTADAAKRIADALSNIDLFA